MLILRAGSWERQHGGKRELVFRFFFLSEMEKIRGAW